MNARGKMRQLFESPSGPLLKSCLGPLASYGTHQETISGRLEQAYLPSDSRLGMAWRPLFKLDLNKCLGGGGGGMDGNVGVIRVTRYGIGVNHYHM